MSCPVCQRSQAGSCVDGYIVYLAGDYPCPFNPDKDWLEVRNPKVLPPLSRAGRLPERTPNGIANVPEREDLSSEGLEDLL